MSVPAVAATPVNTTPSKGLNIALWVVQVLLAAAFIMAGIMKTTSPMDVLHAKMPWTNFFSEGMVRFIGASELLGGLGMLLPSVTRIMPKLTALAGAGLVVVMLLAMAFHVSKGEYVPPLIINSVLGGLAAFVAWGRFKKAPLSPRG